MEALLFLAIVVGLFMAVAIPTIIICKIQSFYYDTKERKFNEKHPEYIEFLKRYRQLQKELSEIWNETMPECRREVDRCLEEIKYYPKTSERYLYLDNKLNVTKRKIEVCQEKYDKKQNEIYQLAHDNKAAIETIKDDEPNSYVNWVERFHLDT